MTNEGRIFRIIDVNLNRATEGLRVVEEICRFIFEDRKLALALKEIRGKLGAAGGILIANETHYQHRKAWEDLGRKLSTKSEERRTNLQSVFTANMKRSQEAVRCLEEFSKLISPTRGKMFKDLRFRLYDLEKQIAPKVSKMVQLDFDLYVVTDPRRDHLKTIQKAVAAGVKMVQLRDKAMPKENYFSLAKKIAAVTAKRGVTFILNDYWDLVEKAGADGVHLGQEDLKRESIRSIRKKLGDHKIIGVSTHSFAQALSAEKAGADYISVGPVFKTPSKPNTRPVGLRLLRRVIKRVKIPVVAIGGINRRNVEKIRKIGCQRAAVIRAAEELFNQKNCRDSLSNKLHGDRSD
jgi:thiamine-phosphate pyrophosphorylase